MGIGKMFASVAAAVTCKLLTENIDMELPQSIVLGMTLPEWVNMVQNNYHQIVSDDWN